MINNGYKPLYQRVQRMQSTLGTVHPQAYALHREMGNLLSDMRANRHPSTINYRMQNIQRQMTRMSAPGQGVAGPGNMHMAAMNHNIGQMRQNVHSFYNFH